MTTFAGWLAVISLVGSGRADAQPAENPQPASQAASDADKPADWLFPVERLNHTLPRWIQFGAEYRSRLESADGIKYTTRSDTYLLSRFRFHVNLQPSRWLTFFAEAQDSHVFFNQSIPAAMPYQNIWDLRQAYVQIGNPKEGWADLVVGRQVLAFGNERVVGPSDWINWGRTFDAVRLNLHHPGYQVSVFASSVVVGSPGSSDHHIQGNNLYGIYGSFKNVIPKATLEPYVFWRLAPGNAGLAETANRGHLNETTTGVRLAGTLPGAFDYEIEMDWQTGSLGANSIRAWAGTWIVGRTFHGAAAAPRVFIESNYASGTKNPSGQTWGTYDQIYPSSHDKLDFADQVGRKNIQQIRAGVEETIGKKWKLRQTYEDLWLATTHDALYTSSGGISIAANPLATSRHIGQELDFLAEYQIRKGIKLGFGYTRLFSGKFLRDVSPGKDYSNPYLTLTYGF